MAGSVIAFPCCEGATFLLEDHEDCDKARSIFVTLPIYILDASQAAVSAVIDFLEFIFI